MGGRFSGGLGFSVFRLGVAFHGGVAIFMRDGIGMRNGIGRLKLKGSFRVLSVLLGVGLGVGLGGVVICVALDFLQVIQVKVELEHVVEGIVGAFF